MTKAMGSGGPMTAYSGTFVGVNDGIHNAEGGFYDAKRFFSHNVKSDSVASFVMTVVPALT